MESKFDLAKWLAGEMTDEETVAFEQSSEFETYRKINEYSSQLEAPDFDSERILQNVVAHKKETEIVKFKLNWMAKIAAVLVIGLGIGLFFLQTNSTTEMASAGKKTTFLLPDNSEVVLNSGSEIKYKKFNWKYNRELNLKGEAFFKVAKGENFDVNTNLGKVTVVGTQFNVKSRNNNFEVECFEGKVKVSFNGKQVLLTKGKSIFIQNGAEIESRDDISEKPNWLQNEIEFNNNSLSEIVAEIERQYNISIENKLALDKKFSGILPSDNLETALEILSKTYKIKYSQPTKTKVILTKNE
jgi:transmembrane sensor